MLFHLVCLVVGDRGLAPGIWTVDSRAMSALSDPTISWRIRPFGRTAVGVSPVFGSTNEPSLPITSSRTFS